MPAQAAHFSISARFGFASLVSISVTRAVEKLMLSGPPVRWPRIVYNWRDCTRLGGRTLIGTGPNVQKRGALLVLIALLATVLAGCGGAGGSSQAPEEQQASKTTGSPEQKSEGAGRLGHPAIGSPDAPVVLTEYSDYQ